MGHMLKEGLGVPARQREPLADVFHFFWIAPKRARIATAERELKRLWLRWEHRARGRI
jgi:hypothetical protein